MEVLPDDALLEVMKYLKIEDLLACRLVCRRLGALAMFPEVWRHQRFELVRFDGTPRYNQCSVLRLAPCVREWRVHVPLKKFHTLYTTTRCAVNNLTLWMDNASEKDSLQASLVIRNQAALGRLRRLSLSFYSYHAKAVEDAFVLLGTVASTPRLEELQLTGFRRFPHSILAGLHRCLPGASLKNLKLDTQSPQAEPFCDFVLSTHAATLESVDLGGYHLTSASTASLLAGMPNLRTLQCGMMPGLEAVAGCEQLRDMELCARYDGEARAVAEFLRRANHLVKLRLEYERETAPPPGVDFMLALATTRRSSLEELSLVFEEWHEDHFPEQQSLLKALPRLPALKQLMVRGVANDDLLFGITPANAPSLSTLKVFSIHAECAHDALHRGAVQELLALNPELKFSVYVQSYCYTGDRCAWCTLGCHQEMMQDVSFLPPEHDDADWVIIPRL